MKNWKYNSYDTARITAELTSKFEDACKTYKSTLAERTSNRATKELSRDNSRGTAIHKFQCNFAWILHGIQCDHESSIDYNVRRATGLIDHIGNISEN